MTHHIISISQVQQQAKEAAKKHSNIDSACPYPSDTSAASIFADAFHHARKAIITAESANHVHD